MVFSWICWFANHFFWGGDNLGPLSTWVHSLLLQALWSLLRYCGVPLPPDFVWRGNVSVLGTWTSISLGWTSRILIVGSKVIVFKISVVVANWPSECPCILGAQGYLVSISLVRFDTTPCFTPFLPIRNDTSLYFEFSLMTSCVEHFLRLYQFCILPVL